MDALPDQRRRQSRPMLVKIGLPAGVLIVLCICAVVVLQVLGSAGALGPFFCPTSLPPLQMSGISPVSAPSPCVLDLRNHCSGEIDFHTPAARDTVLLSAVVTDVRGRSAREILRRLLNGETDAQALAELAHGKLRAKREALAQAGGACPGGRWSAGSPPRVPGTREQLAHLDELDAAIARVDAEREARLLDEREAIALLETIPGVAQRTAEVLGAAIGTDLARFPSAQHLASWAGMCPGTAASGGRHLSGRTRHGNAWLRRTLAEVANGVSRMKGTYLAAQFRRIAARRGRSRAVVAVGHSVLVAISYMLTRHEPYHELGAQSCDEHERAHVQRRLVHRLERLRFAVTLGALPAPAPS